jgi:hypothetical protein
MLQKLMWRQIGKKLVDFLKSYKYLDGTRLFEYLNERDNLQFRFGTGNTGRTGANIDGQTIWKTSNNKYYIWDGSQNSYVDVTSDVKSYKSSGKPKMSGGGRRF